MTPPALMLSLSGERPVDRVSRRFRGVGLVRGEYVFLRCRAHVTRKVAVDALHDYLVAVATVFAPLPVWYRTADLEPSHVRVLAGGDARIRDRNELLGTRALRRAALRPDELARELGAFARAAATCPNLALMFPYVSTAEELKWGMRQARLAGVTSPIGVMAEIPSAILLIERFLDLGVSRVSIGPSDLSRLTLGSYEVPTRYPYFHDAVRVLIDRARTVTRRYRVPLAACVDQLDPATRRILAGHEVDEISINYSSLPAFDPVRFRDLPELSVRDDIKRWARQRLRAVRRGRT